MPTIETLHFVALTRDADYAATNDNVQVIASLDGVDVIDHHIVSGLFLRGEGLHTSPALVTSERLDTAERYSFRVATTGTDLWRPQHVVVFGETAKGEIHPLAGEFDTQRTLSTRGDDDYGAKVTMPLRHLTPVTKNISQVLVVTRTGPWNKADTDDTVNLLITVNGTIVLNQMFPNTPQSDQEKNFANVYTFPVADFNVPANPADFAATLSISGDDDWAPTEFYIFGMSQEGGRWAGLFPLVFVTKNFNLRYGRLCTDPSKGTSPIPLSTDYRAF